MITASRTTIRLRLLAGSVACIAVLLAPAAAGLPQARAADGPSCATAALLVTRGLPRQALALLATPGSAACPDAASAATSAIARSVGFAQEAAESAGDEKWDDARGKATAALRVDRENAAADRLRTQASLEVEKAKAGVAAAAEAKKSWLEKLQAQWKDFVDRQLSPGTALFLPFLGVLLVLVVVARLVVLGVRRWPPADDLPPSEIRPDDESPEEQGDRAEDHDLPRGVVLPERVSRPYILTGGLLSIGGASLVACVVSADAASHPLSPALTVVTLVVTVAAAGWSGWTARGSWQRAMAEPKPPTPDGSPSPARTGGLRGRSRKRSEGENAQGRRPWALSTRRAISRLSVGAAVLAVLMTLARLVPGKQVPDPLEPLAVLGLATVLAVQGVWLLAWWLATRIRLDVKGPTGAAEVGTVAAVLYELGAEKPQGLEVPRGADVTALDGALGSLPENPVLKVLKDIIRSISGVTPWTATIEGDATARVVTVVRNGRTLGSAILDPQRLGLGEESSSTAEKPAATGKATSATTTASSAATADRTLQMAAAFVLTTMAREHPVIARGLAGSTSWKSVGYQYIGSTIDLAPSDTAAREKKLTLLARALDEDGGNRAARLAFRHAIDRDTTDCQGLCRYTTFLADFCTDLDGPEIDFETTALRLRATYTRALLLVNAVYAHKEDGHATKSGTPCGRTLKELTEGAQGALGDLLELVKIKDSASSPDPLEEFKTQFADDVKGTLFLTGLSPDVPRPSSPTGMYNLGCAFASRHDVVWPVPKPDEESVTPLATDTEADDATALGWLELACQDPANKAWMPDDPQLGPFRTRQTYRNTFLTTPRDDFFALSTLTPFASRLKTAGYGDVSLLAAAEPKALGTFLSAAPEVRAQLVELARLHAGLTSWRRTDGGQLALPGLQGLQDLLTEISAAGWGIEGDVPGQLQWWADLLQGALGDSPPAPETTSDPGLLDRWAIEILDELTTRGLAHHDALVALPADRQVALAEEIAETLMKKHQPGTPSDIGDLATYETRLSTAIASWFRRPYEPSSA